MEINQNGLWRAYKIYCKLNNLKVADYRNLKNWFDGK